MTTVVVVRKNEQIALACDTLITFGDTCLPHTHESNEKVFKMGDSYIGMTGNVAHFPVLRKGLAALPPEDLRLHSKDDIFDTFSKLHRLLKEKFFLQTSEFDKDPYESSQFTVLIANPSGIYGVYSYREIFEFKRFWSIGSGRSFALGAMEALYAQDLSAKEIAQAGVNMGCVFDKNSAAPVHVWSLALDSAKTSKGRSAPKSAGTQTAAKVRAKIPAKTSAKTSAKTPAKTSAPVKTSDKANTAE